MKTLRLVTLSCVALSLVLMMGCRDDETDRDATATPDTISSRDVRPLDDVGDTGSADSATDVASTDNGTTDNSTTDNGATDNGAIDNGASDETQPETGVADTTTESDTSQPDNTPIDIGTTSSDCDLVLSELMYDAFSDEDVWEWFELYNAGDEDCIVGGWIADDGNSLESMASGNVCPSGGCTVPPGGVAVFYNSDGLSESVFQTAWPSATRLVPVTSWDSMRLGNSGDSIGVWASMSDYGADVSADSFSTAHAVVAVTYDDGADGGTFPDLPDGGDGVPGGGPSIYLTNLEADASLGASWTMSSDGVDGAVTSTSTGDGESDNTGQDVGSPGLLP